MDVRDLRGALLKKLHAVEDSDRKEVYYYFVIGGREIKATHLSHSARGQIDDTILLQIARQLRLRKAELEDLVECPLSEEEYFRLWEQRSDWAYRR